MATAVFTNDPHFVPLALKTGTEGFPPYDERKLEEFKKVYKEKGSYDFMSQVPYLSDLAVYYEERFKVTNHWADAVKAHGLYNSCMSRDGNVHWSRKAFSIQELYWNGLVKISYEDHIKIMENVKGKLENVRRKIEIDLLSLKKTFMERTIVDETDDLSDLSKILCEKTPVVMKTSTQMMVDVASTVIKYAADLVTTDETLKDQMCVVGFGSMAREEATPYSDLEFMFLIPDATKDNKSLYEKISVTSYFLMGNIGETPLKGFEIKELGLGEKRWFSDNKKSGFKFDGLQEQAGHIPTGNQYMYDKSPNDYITTVDELVHRYKTVYENPDLENCKEGDLSTMLSTLVLIHGDNSLLDKLREQISAIPTNSKRDNANRIMLEADIQKFNFGPDATLRELKSIKKDFFRYASIITLDIKLYFNVKSSRAVDVITQLRRDMKISRGLEKSLKRLYMAAQYIRQASYQHYRGQREEVTVLSTTSDTHNRRIPWSIPHSLLTFFLTHLMAVKNQINDSMTDIDVLLENRPLLHKEYLAMTKYYCGDYRGFLTLIGKTDSIKSLDIESYLVWAKMVSLLKCNEFSEAWQMVTQLLMSGNICECRKCLLNEFMSRLYYRSGDYGKAINCLKENLSVFLKVCGDTGHDGIAKLYEDIGRNYHDQGNYKKALENYENALSMEKEICGDVDHIDIASLYNNIAIVYHSQADYQKALDHFKKALSIRLKVYGDVNHPDIASSYNNIGACYKEQADYTEALDYYERALSMKMKVYGDHPHLEVATSCDNIAIISRHLRNYEKAIYYCEKALSVRLKVYDNVDHAVIIASYNNLGNIYVDCGDGITAISNFEKALSICKKFYGKDVHADIANSYINIARVYKRNHDYSAALDAYKKALSIFKKVYGGVDHPQIAKSYYSTATIYMDLHDYNKALHNYKKALSIFRKVYDGADHHLIASSYYGIATVFCHQGYHKKALDNYEKALSIRLKIYGGVDHPDIALVYREIAKVYQNLGDYRKALNNYHKAISMTNSMGKFN